MTHRVVVSRGITSFGGPVKFGLPEEVVFLGSETECDALMRSLQTERNDTRGRLPRSLGSAAREAEMYRVELAHPGDRLHAIPK